ncbi:MAG TPA: DUF4129 domain-containing protein [Vicinamibacteria bacterium]|nr:DUF4129 domain-containing protein [Vicinamibacteria bacterium]
MSGTRRAAAEELYDLRTAALYLLSLHAAGVALIAWSDHPALAIGAAALVLLAALAGGEAVASRISAGGWWARNRAAAVAIHGVFMGLSLLTAALAPAPALLRTFVSVFTLVQAATLLSAAWGRGAVSALANALVLVSLAALAGGVVAAAAVVGTVALQAAFLVFDHFARTLAVHRHRAVPLRGVAIGEAARAALPPAALLALFLVAAPPRAHSALALERLRQTQEATAAYRLLALLVLAGGGGLYVVRKTLRPAGEAEPVLEEAIESLTLADEAIAEPPKPERRLRPGMRGRIVGIYVAFLQHAARLGWLRPSHLTAPEFASLVVREPEGALGRLTEIFVRARYGPDEPTEDDARAAEGAAREALVRLRERAAAITREGGSLTSARART